MVIKGDRRPGEANDFNELNLMIQRSHTGLLGKQQPQQQQQQQQEPPSSSNHRIIVGSIV